MTKEYALRAIKHALDEHKQFVTNTYGHDVYYQQLHRDAMGALKYVNNWFGSDPIPDLFTEAESNPNTLS